MSRVRANPPPIRSGSKKQIEQALTARPIARTEHFALYHVGRAAATQLSTVAVPASGDSVDDFPSAAVIVAKRHARRAVTRSLIKRQAKAVLQCSGLGPGVWLVRLRSPFDIQRYRSAASAALRLAVGAELVLLLSRRQ